MKEPSDRAIEMAAQCWCDPSVTNLEMDVSLAKAVAIRIDGLLEHMNAAWVIIANSWDGDWDEAPPEWKEAAERWRDKYHLKIRRDERSNPK